ncbi:MAG: 30S ribosomal protein S3 [Candidatus Margulisiibacteriota bacterium]|jgi:small subunit ribosomal protein S3
MGQKVNPNVIRIGINKKWSSIWFELHHYKDYLLEDFKIRNKIKVELKKAGIAAIEILRRHGEIEVNIKVARPGLVIGKGGTDVRYLKEDLADLTGKRILVNIIEEKDVDKCAKLLAEGIVQQLEKRVPFRRAMKMTMQKALKAGAEGIKICCAGRLGGVEIARTEIYKEGKVPLQTFRADIDYSFTEALTTFGKIGVKVWVYKGEVYDRVSVETGSNE